MKVEKSLFLSLIGPLMIFISIIGLALRQENKKIFYVPIGLMGGFMIFEKEISRKLKRQNLFKKIKSYQKIKN